MKTVTYNENECRLVPVVATEEMIIRGGKSCDHPSLYMGGPSRQGKKAAERIYRSMLEAAPKPGEVMGKAVAYMPFGDNTEYGEVAITDHAAMNEESVRTSVMRRARQEGYKGNTDDRLAELGWIIKPVYLQPQPDAARDADAKIRALRNRLVTERMNSYVADGGRTYEHARALAEADINEFEQAFDAAMAAGRGETNKNQG